MIRCRCGGKTAARNASGYVPPLDAALNVYTRHRKCSCGQVTKTVELPATELGELRRRAYLWERYAANETRVAPASSVFGWRP